MEMKKKLFIGIGHIVSTIACVAILSYVTIKYDYPFKEAIYAIICPLLSIWMIVGLRILIDDDRWLNP